MFRFCKALTVLSYIVIKLATVRVSSTEINTVVSKGVLVDELPDVILYSDEERLVETIQDLPDPAQKISFKRNGQSNITADNNDAITEVYHLLEVMHKIFSFKGLGTVNSLTNVTWPSNRFKIVKASDPEVSVPTEEELAKFQPDMLEKLKYKLSSRRFAHPDERIQVQEKSRTKRFAWTALAKPLLSAGLMHLNKKIFLPRNGMLKSILKLQSISPSGLLNFAKSEFVQSELVKLSTLGLQNVSKANSKAIKDYYSSMGVLVKETKTMKQADRFHQRVYISALDSMDDKLQLADNTNLIFNAILYFMQLNALQSCRDGSLPVTFVPPSMLQLRLRELKEFLPDGSQFVVPEDEIQTYYTLKKTTCLWDADGGTVEVQIPVKRNDEQFSMFQFKSLSFAWQNMTCDIGVDSGYVVVEKFHNIVYPISNADEEDCQPKSTGMCRVPMASNTDWENELCVKTLLEGGTVENIQHVCPLNCHFSTLMTMSQPLPSTLIVTHLPKTGTKVTCKNGFVTEVTHNFTYGAFRFVLPFACTVMVNGKVIGRSKQKIPIVGEKYSLDHLLPAHWSVLKDWVAHSKGISSEFVFKGSHDIFDESWTPQVYDVIAEEESVLTTKIPVWSTCWSFFQSLFMVYLLFKINTRPAAILAPFINGVEARRTDTVECQPGIQWYILLYIIVGLQMCILMPTVFGFIWSNLKKLWHKQVNDAAIKRVVQME